MLRVFTRQIQKLHSEEGQALVFVAMVGMVIFLFVAMTMNLSELINIKVKGQNVADATALSGAAWQSRALNTIAGLNEVIMYWWAHVLVDTAAAFLGILLVQSFCCDWTCMANPLCVAALVVYAEVLILVIDMLFEAIRAGILQDEVVNAFTPGLLQEDLPKVVDLNYYFKDNTRDLATGFHMYTHENAGNLWVDDPAAAGHTRYLLERAGFCELMVGVFYHLCRRGYVPGCGADWRVGWGSVLTGLRLGSLYQPPGATPAGPCYRSQLPAAWAADFRMYLMPYVLHTYHETDWTPEDFEELLPVTVGVYRQRQPPVVHLWGTGLFRNRMDCASPPGAGKTNWFPCTDQGHFAFGTARPYSQWVYDFYRSFADAGISTPYPIPLAFGEMDWEQRLLAMEPGQETGQVSPECGWQAYSDIATQIGLDPLMGPADETYLRDNILSTPADPARAFFLY